MKQLLIFFFLLVLALGIDLHQLPLPDPLQQTISITVTGAVKSPGIREVPLHATVQEVLEQTELLDNADTSSLNPLLILHDQDYLAIPAQQPSAAPAKVSINTGTVEQLATLKGIGPKTAEKIVAYRQEHGLFQQLDELKQVSGIGDSKYEAIKDQICL